MSTVTYRTLRQVSKHHHHSGLPNITQRWHHNFRCGEDLGSKTMEEDQRPGANGRSSLNAHSHAPQTSTNHRLCDRGQPHPRNMLISAMFWVGAVTSCPTTPKNITIGLFDASCVQPWGYLLPSVIGCSSQTAIRHGIFIHNLEQPCRSVRNGWHPNTTWSALMCREWS